MCVGGVLIGKSDPSPQETEVWVPVNSRYCPATDRSQGVLLKNRLTVP